MKPVSWPLPSNAPRLLFVAAAVFLLLTAHFLLFQFHTAQAQGDIIYVNAAANGAANGSSWDDAYTSLQDALADAGDGDEIWIAAGIYYPDEGGGQTDNDRTSRFNITPGVSVYGGFAGTETELEERDWKANPTVLSGDIDHETNPDEVDAKGVVTDTANIKGANAYHVVWLSGATTAITASTLIDGVIITAGQASVSPLNFPQNSGGGLFCGGRVNVCNPMLSNVTFSGNSAYRGGAMFNDGHQGQSSPTLSNVTFAGNSATDGGAMVNNGDGGQSSPMLTNVTFSGNWASDGGAMYNDGRNGGASSPTLTNVTFSGNWAEFAGAMYNDGVNGGVSSPVLTNVTFSGNRAGVSGGAVYNYSEGGESSPTLTNVTFTGNWANQQGGAMYNDGVNGASSPTLTNVILWGNSAVNGGDVMYNSGATPTIAYSLVQGGWNGPGISGGGVSNGGGNIDGDPLFITPINPADTPTTGGNLRLQLGSPAIDAGDNGVLPPGLTTDLDGNPRIAGSTVDIGAYEFQFQCDIVGSRLYVDDDATGAGDGSSWDDAFTSLRHALQTAAACNDVDEIWVAEGVYTPGVSRSDSFNIPSGVSLYGGFAGSEEELEERNWEANPTVLSGDIGGDDVTDVRGVVTDTVNIVGDNAYHVVKLDGTTTPITASTRLDSVIITAGHANGGGLNERGGGLYCDGGEAGGVCSPTLTNVIFSGNSAFGSGAAMYNEGRNGGESSPTLTNVTFSSNRAGINGGAMYNYGVNGESSPTLTNVTFAGNRAEASGGAMFNNGGNSGQSSPTLTNVIFSGNQTVQWGGAMFNHGQGGTSSPALTNATFAGNRANWYGGALFNYGSDGGESSPTLINVILWDNSAGVSGDVMYNDGTGVTPTIAHSLVQGGLNGSGFDGSSVTDGGNNIDVDPMFMMPVNPDHAPTTAGDLRLRSDSLAIDAGDDGALPGDLTTDFDGNPRIQGGAVDMGAYEFQFECVAVSSRLYVDGGATGAGDGSSWDDAFTSLRNALLIANFCGHVDEIWMAEGVYTPGFFRSDSFNIPSGVSLYGGFAGDETQRDQRKWEDNPTVLSGDIGGDDVTDVRGVVTDTVNIVGGNAYHVVKLDGTTTPITASTRIDGVVITAGHANGGGLNERGGGLFCDGREAGSVCSPTLTNVIFSGNLVLGSGAAMYNEGRNGGQSSPTLTNVTFSSNRAGINGGAMYNYGVNGESSPTLTNVTFAGNRAEANGGTIFNNGGNSGQSSPTLTNVTFSGNRAGVNGGAMFSYGRNGGQIHATLTNVTFAGNRAENNGGAMYNDGDAGDESSPTLTNVILWGNSAGVEGDVMFNLGATPTIAHSLVEGGWDGSGIAGSSGTDGGNNIDGDPLFMTPINPADAPTTAGDLRLRPGSPAIDAGDDGALPPGVTTDLAGGPRLIGGAVDMGAYEFMPRLYVDRDASGNNNGSSWSDAFTSLQDALLLAYDGSEIWVAEGIYTPGANVGDSFNIPPGVSFYGGFAGIEDELEERDWEAHPTVLSGDIGGDDVTDERGVVISTANIVGDNALHVVTLDGTTTPITASTRLDGVIITAGQANGSDVPDDSGGGLYCNGSGADGMCSPVLSNISFAGNSAAYGGAMYNDGRNGGTSSPTLTNVTYSGNQADSYGGAMYNDGGISGESSPTLTNAAFSGNRAGTGGGAMYNNGGNSGESSPTLTNVNFAGNGAQIGGAMYNVGGGDNGQSSPTLTNVVFSGNQAGLIGGALVNDGEQGGTSSPTLTNVTFSGNSAAVYGGAMFNFSFDGESSPALTNVILWDNSAGHEGDVMYNDAATPTIAYSLVQGGLDGDGIANSNDGSVIDDGGNIDGDPLFVTPVNPDDAPTIAGDLRLRIGSPAIDAGDNDALPAGLDTDLDGSPRIKGGAVDMGAYEYIPALLAVEMTPSSVVEDSGQALTVTFNRTQNTVGELVVAFDVGGTATFNDDYVQFGATSFDGSSGTVTLGDGVISHTLLITPTADSVVEPDETVTLTLIPGVFYEVEAAATVTGTILNDDDPPPAEYWAYLPLLFSPLPPPGLPDLVVQELAVSGDGVTVIIANVGESAVVDPFWVDVYIDPDPVPTGANQIWPLLAEEGLAWGIGGEALPLQPGASLTLTVGDDYFVPDASHFSGAIAVGAALYAQVDSAHSDTDYGAVLEAHEADGGAYNNVAGPVLTPGTLIMSWSQAVSPSASGLLPPR